MKNNIHAAINQDKDRFLTPQEVADTLKIQKQTLSVWRCRGRGPNFISIDGGRILYQESDVLVWLESKKVICTHQTYSRTPETTSLSLTSRINNQ